jgi:sirohydrochlorin cobaltochelatase
MKTPIVMAAFGTTSKALDTYSFIDETVKQHFPEHEILWAYSSRMVRDSIKKERNLVLKPPREVLEELESRSFEWAVVQSLHLMCGHEFNRLVAESQACSIRTAIGLPLLCAPEDYLETIEVLRNACQVKDEAVVLVGHGSDHPSWCTYMALQQLLNQKIGRGIYVGMVEEGCPSQEEIVAAVQHDGFEKVRLMPFLLVAGVHFHEDLAGAEDDSWKSAFEKKNIAVSLVPDGIGKQPGIIDIFCRHIQSALDIIPR